MKIAFLGVKGSISYNRIGGAESIVRRLGHEIIKNGGETYIISYQEKDENETAISDNLYRVKLNRFQNVLDYLSSTGIKKVFTLFVAWKDRPKLFKYRLLSSEIQFNAIITNYKNNWLKRMIFILETVINYRKGFIFCTSPRLLKEFRFLSKSNSKLLLPPVDDAFFVNEIKKADTNRVIKIAYMGRLDYGKGSDIAIDYFKESKLEKAEFYVFAYPHKTDPFSMKLHNELKNQDKIKYIETELNEYSPDIDQFLKETIDQIDIFVLPYRFVHSTVDTPLVPLEIMARNKIFITTNVIGMKHLLINKELIVPIDAKRISDVQVSKIIQNNNKYLEDLQNLKKHLAYNSSAIVDKIQKIIY